MNRHQEGPIQSIEGDLNGPLVRFNDGQSMGEPLANVRHNTNFCQILWLLGVKDFNNLSGTISMSHRHSPQV